MRNLLLCSFLILASASWSLAQSVSMPTPSPQPRARDPFDGINDHGEDQATQRLEQMRIKKAQEERRKQIGKDTDRLTQLVSDLKDLLAKADSTNVLSLDAVKKAEEIEKLAKRLKNNLRDPVQ